MWPDVSVQRCTVHKHRNLLAHAPDALREEVSADYSDMIYAATPKRWNSTAWHFCASAAALSRGGQQPGRSRRRQITLRKADGWQTLTEAPAATVPLDLAV